jgi:hypothetical protein
MMECKQWHKHAAKSAILSDSKCSSLVLATGVASQRPWSYAGEQINKSAS